MRKTMLFAVALVVLPTVAQAQNSITATARINPVAAFVASQNMAWSAITPTQTGNSDAVVDGTNGTPGYVSYWSNGATTPLTVSLPTTLTSSTSDLGTSTVSFTCAMADNSNTKPSTFGACAGSMTRTRPAGAKSEVFRLWFGGKILGTAIDGAAAGDYTGTITVTAGTPTA